MCFGHAPICVNLRKFFPPKRKKMCKCVNAKCEMCFRYAPVWYLVRYSLPYKDHSPPCGLKSGLNAIFVLIPKKNYKNVLLFAVSAYGLCSFSAQKFPPKELYFRALRKNHHFSPKAAQTDLSGRNLPATFRCIATTSIIIFHRGIVLTCHNLQVRVRRHHSLSTSTVATVSLVVPALNMTPASSEDEFVASEASSSCGESESETLADLEQLHAATRSQKTKSPSHPPPASSKTKSPRRKRRLWQQQITVRRNVQLLSAQMNCCWLRRHL